MDPTKIGIFFLVAAVIVLVIWLAKIQAERERQRRAALAEFARQNGMQFSQKDPWQLDRRYHGVGDIGQGHARYAFDVLVRPTLSVFQYHFKTWETRTVRRNNRTYTERYEKTHYRKYLIQELPVRFPGLILRAEGLFDKLAGFVGFDDIDFESEAFSKRYFCKSDSKEFAYQVIHPQMMEYLMDLNFAAELKGQLLVMDLAGYNYTAEELAGAMNKAAGFINRIPDFVWQDHHGEPMKVAEVRYAPAVAAG